MNMPDVTAIIYDPEVGGGQEFQVERNTLTRVLGGYSKSAQIFDAIGNIQPQEDSNQTSTSEDLLNESIVIYSPHFFQTGSNNGTEKVESDIVRYNGSRWRVTRVDDWSKWGWSRAYATKIRDKPGTEG